MEETPKIHHHKSKHRKSSSRRTATATENNNVNDVKDREVIAAAATVAPTTEIDDIVGGREVTASGASTSAVASTSDTQTVTVVEVVASASKRPTDDDAIASVDAGSMVDSIVTVDERQMHKGIIGYMDREIKAQRKPPHTLSDPTASPAQRSIRSRSSVEKSPRQKRSKSESRRRRERKLIAAGELEVKQANETLMRYLKQCSQTNDASLSGELEIDKSIDDRRVHRKTKSQRERRSVTGSGASGSAGSNGGAAGVMAASSGSFVRDRMPPSGLSSILHELASDVVPAHGEIYNPFTPVISPTDGASRTDRMFIQTPHGFRSISESAFFKESMHDDGENRASSGVNLSCIVQRIWILISNICHGLLAGLALAHILFLITTTPSDWTHGSIKHYSDFAELYTNTFYCLAIVCLVSIFDRMDICRWNFSTSTESISFQWIIIVMLYLATIILSLSTEAVDERLYLSQRNATAWEHGEESKRVVNIWNSLSLARSVAAIIGWMMIGFTSGDDMLYEHLLEMEKYQQQ